jgi:RHS repeat-associated protein
MGARDSARDAMRARVKASLWGTGVRAGVLALAGVVFGAALCEGQGPVQHCPGPGLGLVDTGAKWCGGPLAPTYQFDAGACGCNDGQFFFQECYPPGYAGAVKNQGCEVGGCYIKERGACLGGEIETPEPHCPSSAGKTTSGPSAPAAPTSDGHPVSLTSGSVFFTHTDATVGELSLGRTYHSGRLAAARHGVFGAGWNGSLERRLRVLNARTVEARLEDGFAQYYFDREGDGSFEAILPKTSESRLEAVEGGGYRRVLRGGGSESYDAGGRILQAVDEAGVATTWAYDERGRCTGVSRRGRSVGLLYVDDTSRPAQATGPGGLVLATYTYDPSGNLATVRYPDGGGYRYGYDGLGNMSWVSDLEGRILERHEYRAGKATTSEVGDGREKLTFAYDSAKTTVTDATGVVTEYAWEEVAHVPRVTKATGPCASCGGSGGAGVRTWTYDASGNTVRYQNEIGDVWKYTYSPENDLLTETNPFGQTTTYTYSPDGRVHTRAGPDGSLQTYAYGPAGPTSITEKLSQAHSRTTTLSYTADGQVEAVSDPRQKITRMSYTATGDLETVTDPLGHVTRFGYDDFGRRTSVEDALGHTTRTVYDVRGRVTSTIEHDLTHTDFAYDTQGRRVSVTDPEGRQTRYVYGTYGWLAEVIDPAGGVTRYGYDLMGRLTSLTDAMGRTTRFVYELGRLIRAVYPGEEEPTESYTYDAAGRMETKTDRRGTVTTFEYDPLGRLKRKSYSDGTPPVVYGYDAGSDVGRLTSATNGTDTLRWSYDLAGDLLTEASTKNASVVSYTYDVAGNRLSLLLDGQVHASYVYDDASRLTAIRRGGSGFGFAYDAAHRRTGMTYPNGVVTTYTYDALNRLTRLKADKGALPITDFQYTYDPAGNRTRKQQLDYTEDYGYDALYRLSRVERTAGPTALSTYTYDPVGNRTTAQTGSAVLTSSYNEKNQLLQVAGGGAMLWRGTLDEPGKVTFTSALVNGKPARMLAGNVFEAMLDMQPGTNTVSLQATDTSGNVTTKTYEVDVTGTGASYTYDSNGNLASKTEGSDTWGYEWNALNQLTRVTRNSVEQARFAYDPEGRRVEKVAGGVTTTYTYSGDDILREIRGATTLRYVHGPDIDEPLAVDDGTSLSYYHADGLGSVVKKTNAAGAATQTRQYDAWGNLESGASEPGCAFTGREWDPETRLYHYRARYYDPKIGRFISEDPIKWLGGINPYGYGGNNPVNRTDPSGLQACCSQGGATGYASCWSNCVQTALGNAANFLVGLGVAGATFAIGNAPVLGGALTAGEYGGLVAGAAAGLAAGLPNPVAVALSGATFGGGLTGAAGIAAAGAAGYSIGTFGYCAVRCAQDPCFQYP